MLRISFHRFLITPRAVSRNLKKYTIIRNEFNECKPMTTNMRNYIHTNIITSQKHVRVTMDTTNIVSPNKIQNEILSEQDYFIKIKHDPDKFGTNYIEEKIDADDFKEEEFLSNPPSQSQKLSTKQYADIIKDLIRKKKLKEAIDVLEVRMLKEDQVKPENYIYNLIIGACGRVGYTKKAFALYNQMKQRGLKVTPATYTALFNACANSPWLEDGLKRATHLRGIMIEKQEEPNDTNFNAMIKAFGRCGDLNTSFSLVDEMIQKKNVIKDDTINFLLQACITDKDAGFRHSLLVWRKLIDKGIEPSLFTYNLLLRSIRDCGLGDLDVTKDVISKLLPQTDQFLEISSGGDTDKLILDEHNRLELSEKVPDVPDNSLLNKESSIMVKQQPTDLMDNRPNLMLPVPHLGNILSLAEVTKPEDRLLLVGGANSFLQNMFENKCTPDIKTFTQLLDCIPSTLSAEKELIIAMKKNNIKADIDFYNMLIKKRSMRFDFEAAKDVLQIFKKSKMQPNLITYGVLALGCKNREEALSLIEEMHKENYRLNTEILGAMLQQACYHNNFKYVLEIMEMCIREEISPNMKFIAHLEKFKKKCKHYIDEKKTYTQTQLFQKGYQMFRLRYSSWKDDVKLEENIHPWEQFRNTTDTNGTNFKDKESKSRFKQRHTSLFRQKTSAKFVDNKGRNNNYDNKYNNDRDNKYIPKKRYKETKLIKGDSYE